MYSSYSLHGYGSSIANVQNLLEYDSTSLEDLLDEGDLIQECHAENQLLVDFFCRPANLAKILRYTAGFTGAGERVPLAKDRKLARYAFVCSELVCSELDPLLRCYLAGKGRPYLVEYLAVLRELNKEDKLELLYWYRCLACLLQHNPAQLLQLIRDECPQFADQLLSHLHCPSVIELAQRLIGNEHDESNQAFVDFLSEQAFFQRLFDKFISLDEMEAVQGAEQLLIVLSEHPKRSSLFVALWNSNENLSHFLDAILGLPSEQRELVALGIDFLSHSMPVLGSDAGFISQVERVVAPHLRQCLARIDDQSSAPHFGLYRLKMAELIRLFISLASRSLPVAEAVINSDAFSILIRLFFQYKRCNFLHSVLVQSFEAITIRAVSGVKSTTAQSLEWPSDCCMKHLLLQTPLIPLIVEAFRAQSATRALPLGGSPDHTVSYLGHLIQICDLICAWQSSTDRAIDPAVRDRLQSEDWTTFIGTQYASLKTVETCLLGGTQAPAPSMEGESEGEEPFVGSSNNESLLFFTREERQDFEFNGIQAEQLGRLVLHQLAHRIHQASDHDEEQQDSFPICSSLGLIFNEGPPSHSPDWTEDGD